MGGFDDHVGELSNRLHEGALVGETFADGEMLSERVRAAGFTVTPQEGVFVGFDIDERDGMIFFQVLQKRRQFFKLRAFARVNKKRGTREITFAGGV